MFLDRPKIEPSEEGEEEEEEGESGESEREASPGLPVRLPGAEPNLPAERDGMRRIDNIYIYIYIYIKRNENNEIN